VLSSISSSFGAVGVGWTSCNPSGIRCAEWLTLPSAGIPRFIVAIVSRDHGLFSWTVAFFKESMRRDDMTGTKIVLALWVTG